MSHFNVGSRFVFFMNFSRTNDFSLKNTIFKNRLFKSCTNIDMRPKFGISRKNEDDCRKNELDPTTLRWSAMRKVFVEVRLYCTYMYVRMYVTFLLNFFYSTQLVCGSAVTVCDLKFFYNHHQCSKCSSVRRVGLCSRCFVFPTRRRYRPYCSCHCYIHMIVPA